MFRPQLLTLLVGLAVAVVSSWLIGAAVLALLDAHLQERTVAFWLVTPLILGTPIVLFLASAAVVIMFWGKTKPDPEFQPLIQPPQL